MDVFKSTSFESLFKQHFLELPLLIALKYLVRFLRKVDYFSVTSTFKELKTVFSFVQPCSSSQSIFFWSAESCFPVPDKPKKMAVSLHLPHLHYSALVSVFGTGNMKFNAENIPFHFTCITSSYKSNLLVKSRIAKLL
jgi:hypothetical protein